MCVATACLNIVKKIRAEDCKKFPINYEVLKNFNFEKSTSFRLSHSKRQ